MELIPEAHGGRFVVPAAITLEELEEYKRGVQLPSGAKYEDFYPALVLSYASGRRPGDCEGSGPGVVYAKGMMEFFHERGLKCFSGLQVPPGVDWETFMLRLTGENGKREKPKVLIIILTAALYQSKPCLKEIDTAIRHEVALLPVRFEDKLPGKAEQWTNLVGPDWEMRKFRVQEKLNSLNNIPNPGTVLDRATALQDIMAAVEKHLPAPASPALMPLGHGVSPLVMEREGVTGDAAASKPTPQPPAQRFKLNERVECRDRGNSWQVGTVVSVEPLEVRPDGTWAAGHAWDEVRALSPWLKLEGGSLTGKAARYPGTYRLVVGKLVNGRPAYQHTSDATLWIAFAGIGWMGQTEDVLGQKLGFLDLQDAAAASPDVSTKSWMACAGSTWVEAPQLKCIPWTPPLPVLKLNERVECRDRGNSWQGGTVVSVEPLEVRPDGTGAAGHAWDEVRALSPWLKLEGGSLTGEAAKYPGTYRLVVGKLVNGRPAYQHTSDATRWIAFDGDSWMGQTESVLGEKKGNLDLRDAAAASPDVSTMTWKANAGGGAAWVEAPQLKCIPWTPPPPVLKLEGGSLPGAAAEYMGEYRLVVDDRVGWPPQAVKAGWRGGPMLVNGRPAWRHTTHLTCWLAFDGANWRGQPEASLGQKSGFLLLSDAAALSPGAISATWLAANGPGSAWAAQPQLKCIPCAAPELSQVELEELPVKNFGGPCADNCKPLAPCCCVSADGEAIFGCVPTKPGYFLPACLHMALCPHVGCDPKGGLWGMNCQVLCFATLLSTLCALCVQDMHIEDPDARFLPW